MTRFRLLTRAVTGSIAHDSGIMEGPTVLPAIRSAIRTLLHLAAAALLLSVCEARAAQTVINFDDVADGKDIRTQYQPLGVTFSCSGTACSGPSITNKIYARATTGTPSAPNSVTPLKLGIPGVSDAITGRVIATFADPAKSVSVDARSVLVPEPLNQTAYAQIIAYDAQGATVASAAGSQSGAYQTLTVTAPDNRIAKVSLGVTGPVAVATFDNLKLERDWYAVVVWWWWWWVIVVVILGFLAILVKRRKRAPGR